MSRSIVPSSPRRLRSGLVAILLLVLVPVANAQQSDFLRSNPKFIAAFREVVAPHVQAVVRIQCDGKETCLGVFVDTDGSILTKAHDLTGKIVCKLADGQSHEARVIGIHEAHDLALLQITGRPTQVIRFADAKGSKPGSWVASVGMTKEPAAFGVISVATRKVKEAYLGIQIDPTPQGVVVQGVQPKSAAANAGLNAKDHLVSVNGKPIESADHLQQLLGDMGPGDNVTLRVRRDGKELDLKATLQSREQVGDFRSEFQNRMGSELSTRRSGYSVILQHDSVLKPADCGSPLVDLQGRVIGINTSRAGRTESWAIPAEVVTALLPELKSGRLAPEK